MSPSSGNGIIDIPSNHSSDMTVKGLKGILNAKGVTLFPLVDHSGDQLSKVPKENLYNRKSGPGSLAILAHFRVLKRAL